MALLKLKLFVDVEGKRLVQSDASDSAASLPKLVQGDTVSLEIYLLQRSAYYPVAVSANLPFNRISPTGISIRVGIGTPSSSASGSAPSIYQNSFTADTANACFRGLLTLGRSAVASMLGSDLEKTFTLEIEVNDGESLSTVLYEPVVLRGDLLKTGEHEEPATPGDHYLTLAEALSIFMRRVGETSITLYNSDNTKAVTLYVDSNGALQTGSYDT